MFGLKTLDFERERARFMLSPEEVTDRFDSAIKLRKKIQELEMGRIYSPYRKEILKFIEWLANEIQGQGTRWYISEIWDKNQNFLNKNGVTPSEQKYYKSLGPEMIHHEVPVIENVIQREPKLKTKISKKKDAGSYLKEDEDERKFRELQEWIAGKTR